MKTKIKAILAAVCMSELVVFFTHMCSIITDVSFNLDAYYIAPIMTLMIITLAIIVIYALDWITSDLN